MISHLYELLQPIFTWITGPYRSIALMYVAMFTIIGAMDIGISYVKGYMKRRETDRYYQMAKDHI